MEQKVKDGKILSSSTTKGELIVINSKDQIWRIEMSSDGDVSALQKLGRNSERSEKNEF